MLPRAPNSFVLDAQLRTKGTQAGGKTKDLGASSRAVPIVHGKNTCGFLVCAVQAHPNTPVSTREFATLLANLEPKTGKGLGLSLSY